MMTTRLLLFIVCLSFCSLGEGKAQTPPPSTKAASPTVAAAKPKPKVPTAEEIADGLSKAKTTYDEKLKSVRKIGEDGLASATKLARKNKNADMVARIEIEKQRFADNILKVPTMIDGEIQKKLNSKISDARSFMDKEYFKAVGAYTFIARDEEAQKVLVERQKFRDEMPAVQAYVSQNPGIPNAPVQPQFVPPLLPPGGVWKFRIMIAPGLGQEGAVNIRGNEMYHTDAPANTIGMASMDGPNVMYMTFAGHRKIPAGEVTLVRQRYGYWTGTLTRPDGKLVDMEMYR